jgi:hypothetical protein
MYHITDAQLLVGVLVILLLLALLAFKAVFDTRREKSASFRNYFGSGYQRELLRHSDLSESEDWRADRDSRFTPIRLRETSLGERRISSAIRSNREQD